MNDHTQGYISNGAYMITRLKAVYPSFNAHIQKLDTEAKRILLAEYDKALRNLSFADIQAAVSRAIQESSAKYPSVQDILNYARLKPQESQAEYRADPRLEKQYADALLNMVNDPDLKSKDPYVKAKASHRTRQEWLDARNALSRHHAEWINKQQRRI